VREGKLGFQLDMGDALGVGEAEKKAIAKQHGHHQTTGIEHEALFPGRRLLRYFWQVREG